jgi:hypothetical protein
MYVALLSEVGLPEHPQLFNSSVAAAEYFRTTTKELSLKTWIDLKDPKSAHYESYAYSSDAQHNFEIRVWGVECVNAERAIADDFFVIQKIDKGILDKPEIYDDWKTANAAFCLKATNLEYYPQKSRNSFPRRDGNWGYVTSSDMEKEIWFWKVKVRKEIFFLV